MYIVLRSNAARRPDRLDADALDKCWADKDGLDGADPGSRSSVISSSLAFEAAVAPVCIGNEAASDVSLRPSAEAISRRAS